MNQRTVTDYDRGYLDGIVASSWSCADCGNTYDSDVESCPNRLLDEAKAKARES